MTLLRATIAPLTSLARVLVEYAYDAASRVTGITYKQGANVLGNLTYQYDKAGNRTKTGGSFARTGVPQTINSTAYNAANHQTTFGDKTLTYDNNGNLISLADTNGTTLYTWNARNQLTSISGPGVNASFVYDGLARREQKTINSSLTEFLYDGANPVQETSGATVLANVLSGLGIDECFARTDVPATITSHLLPDSLGSTIALADPTGTVQTSYTYEPFGKTTASGASTTNPFQYTNRENDGTGLYYYRARYYHSILQRFVAEDPIEFRGGDINLYGYVINNPTGFVDPFGLDLSDWHGFPSKSEHLNRNRHNICPFTPPRNPTRSLRGPSGGRYDPENWNYPPSLIPETFPGQDKYRSNRGNECKYDANGNILRDGGTYNYEPFPWHPRHLWKDILPTVRWWGSNYTRGLTTIEY
jgi:RHS repeat-associated protein